MKHYLLKLLPLLLISFLSSCDEVIDCIDNDGPEFRTEAKLSEATIGIEYDELILVEIKNEPRDDDFEYFFETETPLPKGITLDHGTYSRRVYLRGTPTEPGEYKFILFVRVFDSGGNSFGDSGDSTENLCYTTKRKEFTITVLP